MNTVAVILARKNSERLKKKHYLKINGKNLVQNTIHFASKLKFIKKIVLSTDDLYFLNFDYGFNLVKIKRPQSLSTSKSSSVSAIKHIFKKLNSNNIKFKNVLLLQPTSPFRDLKIIYKGFKLFKQHKYSMSVISMSKTKNNFKRFFELKNKKLVLSKAKSKNSLFQANGNFYFASKKFILENNSFFCKNKSLAFQIANNKISIDIDTYRDYLKAAKY